MSNLLKQIIALPRYFIHFLIPKIKEDITGAPDSLPILWQAREQIMTGLLRAGAIFGSVTLSFSAVPMVESNLLHIVVVYAGILMVLWLLALRRDINYMLRASVLLICVYTLGLTELLNFGYGEDSHAFLIAFSLLSLIFFEKKAGFAALALSVISLVLIGWAVHSGQFRPFSDETRTILATSIITTSVIFFVVVATVQVGIFTLLNHLEASIQRDQQARLLLEEERRLLEQRVVERTQELAIARDQAIAASRYEAAQKEYLTALHHTTLDLLNRREVGDLLQAMVERASAILDAPYSQLILEEGKDLVVRAFTRNQSLEVGDRLSRETGMLVLQAHTTRRPVILEDVSSWHGQRTFYGDMLVRAVANFPIVVGESSFGVLAMGRVEPGQAFTVEDVQKGVLFSQLAALVLENVRLYDTALREIGERRQAEAALQRYAEELKVQNAELEAFAHTVAHDLKNPLASVVGFSQMLQYNLATMDAQQIQDQLDLIVKTGFKMKAIINELLLLARVRSLEAVPIKPMLMSKVVGEIEMRLHSMIQETQATIVKPDVWPPALGYAPWVEEVWVNYVSNAIKYGGTPPLITLGYDAPEQGAVRFWVRDNGPGLTYEQQIQLFTPFTRLHEGRAQGHGLGLSIVQRIVKRLGGDIGVRSTPGQGSTFFFTLPAPEPPEP
ncbi:MAG TPA: GAF domain-containing sensor histidine kinase [Roseiflexaceae bacterium]|nr:GAF domain-containing sensor histidine kinase [Roseiflexaceae bacterium]